MRSTEVDAAQKLRGGYYTPPEIARWLCDWAIRDRTDRVLEPSCGEGVFLISAASRLVALGASKSSITSRLTGIEVVASEAQRAKGFLCAEVGASGIKVVSQADFFAWTLENPEASFDAIIGNPPFIRYQSFPEPHRTRAMAMMQASGLSPNRLTNIWVPFVVAAAEKLRPGGRLAFVLPAELLQVSYAAQLRSFLADRFSRIDIVACNELFFEGAEQEVLLFLADGARPKDARASDCRVAMTERATVAEIIGKRPNAILKGARPKTVQHDNEKWLKYFLTSREIAFMRELRESKTATPLSTHASVDVGVVTGKNEFFVLSQPQISALELEGFTTPLVSRSVQLRGVKIGKSDWKALSEAGDRVHLLHVSAAEPTAPLRRYIRSAEEKFFHTGYKCSIRKPWYVVPSVWTPDAFMFRQIYDFPRIVSNSAGATSTDTIHRLTAKGAKPERVIANTYTWLTAASAEIEGRSYGGGVLELEPTEAERLLMPGKLNGAMPVAECDRLTRAGRLDVALEENARIVLREHMGLSAADCKSLEDIWVKMRDRRLARRRRSFAASGASA